MYGWSEVSQCIICNLLYIKHHFVIFDFITANQMGYNSDRVINLPILNSIEKEKY